MAAREPSGHEPRAMQRGLLLLEAVAEIGPGATARQLAERTGIPRATAYKLLNVLIADGYLVRIADLSGFALGVRTQLLSGQSEAPASSRNAEILADVRSTVRFGVVLAAFTDHQVRLVDLDPDHELPGAALMCAHPHASAIGKVMLAEVGIDEIGPLRALTAHTVIDTASLQRELLSVKDRGIAIEVDESRTGRSAVAVPVTDEHDRIAGALAAIGRTGRIPVTQPELIQLLKNRAAGLRLPTQHVST